MIELMIALVIFGVLVAAATPGFTQWIANTRVRTTAESVQNGLMQARAEAIASNRKVQFALTTTEPVVANAGSITTSVTGTNWIVRAATPGTSDFTTAAGFIQGRSLAEGGQDVAINAGTAATACTRQATVVFKGLGLISPVPAGMLCIDVSSSTSNRPLRITVSPAGAVRMCDPGLDLSNYSMGCT